MLGGHGFSVVSANTDGITVLLNKGEYELFKAVYTTWEKQCEFALEETRYKALYTESVNSYIAIKENGSLKRKGDFVENDLSYLREDL